MSIDNLTPETQLRRADVAEASTANGFPIKAKTLATMASRGGGPPFQLWGRIPLYTWGPYLDWAKGRLSEPRSSTSEADADTGRPPKPGPVAAAPALISDSSTQPTVDSPAKGAFGTPPCGSPPPAAPAPPLQHATADTIA